MLTEAKMKSALQRYLDGFNQGDSEAITSLFADHAKIEDPVGGGQIIEGKEEIAAFYSRGVKLVKKLELDTPIRTSHGKSAAMAFTIHMEMDGKIVLIQAIDVMTFDESGKIIDMKAFHGPSNVLK